jgi:outer membrane protein assembly factor BamB
MKFLYAFGLAVALLLSACSSTPEGEQPAEPLSMIPSDLTKVKWRQTLGTGPKRQYLRMKVAVSGSTLYAADPEEGVFSIDVATGSRLWHKRVDEKILSGVTLSADASALYFSSKDGFLHAIDSQTGDDLWKVQLTSEAVAPAAADANSLYVHTVDGRISALSTVDGQQRWSYESQQPILTIRGTTSPVLVDTLVLVGMANGKVIALDNKLGVPVWNHRLSFPEGRSELERLGDVDGTVTVATNRLFASSYNGKVAAISLGGEVLWEEDASSYTSPALSLGNLYLTLDDSRIRAHSMDSGDKVWTQSRLEGRKVGGVVVAERYLAVTDSEGFLFLMSRVDGSLVARQNLMPVIRHMSVPNQTEATGWRPIRGKEFGVRSPLIPTEAGLLVYTNAGELLLVAIENS